MNQNDYVTAGGGESQAARIFARLFEARPAWVPLPELVLVSGGYAVHSRISDLRKRGHVIEQRSTRSGKSVISCYKLGE